MKNFFGTLALFALTVAVAGAAHAEGGKNRNASEAITEGNQLCAQAGEGAVLVFTTELEGGETVTVTLDCGEDPGFES
jgi:hypothetical protein